jgi:prepilin-type N-terminal cleavage/methylation domain-containing protein
MVLTDEKVERERMPIFRTGTCSKLRWDFIRVNIGFTLLELIATLFVISVVMALVLPSFTDFGERKLKSEVREMASLLRYMNDSAIARKATFFIKFDLDEGMVSWTGPDGKREKTFDDITGITTQATGRVSKGEITFFFEPLGTRENISVHMSDGENDMSVILYHLSGRVKIT